MTGRRLALVGAAAVLLVLAAMGVGRLLRAPAPLPRGASSPPAPPAPFAFRWPAGTLYTYGLKLSVVGTLGLADTGGPERQPPLTGRLVLEAELALRSYGQLDEEGGPYVLGVRLARLQQLRWLFGEQPILPDGGEALVGPEILLIAAPDGRFRRLEAAAGESDVLLNLFRQVLAPLEVVVEPGARSWTSRQTSPIGEARVAYTVQADERGLITLQRRPAGFVRLAAGPVLGGTATQVRGTSAVVLDRVGHLSRLQGAERVVVTRTDGEEALRQEMKLDAQLLAVDRVSGGPDAARRLAGLEPTGLGEVSTSGDIRRQLLEGRAGDLTGERLVQDLLLHGPAPHFPDLGRWMWRATGLLRLHPELCRDLVAVFASPRMTARGRERVLDLLAATGSPEAQTVLRELLERPEVTGAANRALLVQRLSLVADPTGETVDYLRAQVQQGDRVGSLAAAHSLGAAVGRRSRAAGGEVDEHAAALLRSGLAAASTARDEAAWLGALGNAGLAEDVPLLARYAADQDPSVRAAVADALRQMSTPGADTLLLDLAADPDSYVQGRALSVLTDRPLTPDHLAALRRVVVEGPLGPGSFAALLSLLERHRRPPEASRPVVEALLAREAPSPELRRRLLALHRALTPGG